MWIRRIVQKVRETQGVLPPQIRILRASVEEVPKEELQEPLKTASTTGETFLGEIKIKDDELLIAYIRGEPVVKVFEPQKTPLTEEYDKPKYSYSRKTAKIS